MFVAILFIVILACAAGAWIGMMFGLHIGGKHQEKRNKLLQINTLNNLLGAQKDLYLLEMVASIEERLEAIDKTKAPLFPHHQDAIAVTTKELERLSNEFLGK